MILNNFKNKKKGFVILFAVTISAIILTIAIGVINIAVKEIQFSTSSQKTNQALFIADTAIECALFYDKSNETFIIPVGGDVVIRCMKDDITVTGFSSNEFNVLYNFTLIDNDSQACAKVSILKEDLAEFGVSTKITSKGYNHGAQGGDCTPLENDLERILEVNY